MKAFTAGIALFLLQFAATARASCPSNPGKANLTSPAAGTTNLSSPVTFKWSSVSSAKEYRVWILMPGSEATAVGATTSTSLTASVPAGSGVWFVQTFFGDNCASTLSDRRAFTVTTGPSCSNPAPQLQSPADGTTTDHSSIELRWTKVDKAISYSLYLAAGNDSFTLAGSTSDDRLVRLVPAGTLRWYVEANFSGCPATRSATRQLTVESENCPDGSIELTSPSSDAIVVSPVHFAWTGEKGIEYRVWISVDGRAPDAVLRTSSTSAELSVPAGEIEWFVEGIRDHCKSILSNHRKFTVQTAANCSSHQAPVLESPGTRWEPVAQLPQVTSPVTFKWQAVSGAIAYRLWVAGEGEPEEDLALSTDTTVVRQLDPGLYQWYVEAVFNGCPSVNSSIFVFVVPETGSRCPTGVPSLTVPADHSTATSPVTFSWTGVESADKYRILVSRNGAPAVVLGSTSETSLQRTLPPGTYDWAVESVFKECPSTVSARRTFTIEQATTCNTESPVLVSPADHAANVDPDVTFTWNPVSGAVKYAVFARIGEGAPTVIAETASTSATRLLPAGRKVEWWIVALFAACDPERSDTFSFETKASDEECVHRKPVLLAPDDEIVTSPVHFSWTHVPGATTYRVWAWRGNDAPAIISSQTDNQNPQNLKPEATVVLAEGAWHWFVESRIEPALADPPAPQCPPGRSSVGSFVVGPAVACGTPRTPLAKVSGKATSGVEYRLLWSALPNVDLYEVQEMLSLDASEAETFTTTATSIPFHHEVSGEEPVQYFYRVRGVSNCSEARGSYSKTIGVFVFPPNERHPAADAGTEEEITQTLLLPGAAGPGVTFNLSSDRPWIRFVPAAGTLPVGEPFAVQVIADPSSLALGTSEATISVVYSGLSKGPRIEDAPLSNIPFSMSLVTPVEPGGKGTPPPDSLIFPVVAHVNGANDSFFESDVRVTNLTAQVMRYDVIFTPSGADGTITGNTSTLEVAPGETIALNDILSTCFGEGTLTGAFGVLEVRPGDVEDEGSADLFDFIESDALQRLDTAASSRTYTFTPTGTFGQFIPAIPFAQFVGGASDGGPAPILSLQQVAESPAYRANFGFVEASGNPVDLQVRVYDTTGSLLKTIPVSLQASQHLQLNGMLALNGINNLEDGRVEVEVTGGSGKVTAYVSEVDNRTNDPLLVSPIPKGSVSSTRFVVPGAGYINNGLAFWVTDLRILNSGDSATPATLTFYPLGGPGSPVSKDVTLDAGEIEVINNVLGDFFGQAPGSAGSVVITTPAPAMLNASARTYNQTTNGTYGQYIPGVTPAQSAGVDDRALQLLQLEQSSRFRTNIGLAETSGAPVTVEVTATLPESLASPVVEFQLQANEFTQFPLAAMGVGDGVYNARVSVRVTAGTGKVTTYASVIDQITQDPTYVPAQ